MLTNTYDIGNFLELLSALRWVFSKRYGFSSFSQFIHVAKEKIPQSAGLKWLKEISRNLKNFYATGPRLF